MSGSGEPVHMKRGLLTDVKSIARKSLVYGAGSMLLRATAFLTLPLYTRALSPADYGIIAVTSMVSAVLGVLLPLGLHGALARLYFSHATEPERRGVSGTLWLAIGASAVGLAVVLDRAGGWLFGQLLTTVPFDPYVRLAVWTACFQALTLLPLNLVQMHERPGLYISLTGFTNLLMVAWMVYEVVILRHGVYGYLRGSFLASAVSVLPYAVYALRHVELRIRPSVLRAALKYSLPLIPHGLAGWALGLSDRAILERYVSLSDLGLYSIGYQLGLGLNMVVAAFNYAWVPFMFRMLSEDGQAAGARIVRLATYYALVICAAALGLALFAEEVLALLTPASYRGAAAITPLIVLGYFLNGLYIIPVNMLFWAEKTHLLPLITLTSGTVSIGLNLWLVPIYGVMAAAWATCIAYGVMLALVTVIAQRVYPLAYEYRRLALMCLVALGLYVAASLGLPLGGFWARAAAFALFPVLLFGAGFFTPEEREAARLLLRRVMPAHLRGNA